MRALFVALAIAAATGAGGLLFAGLTLARRRVGWRLLLSGVLMIGASASAAWGAADSSSRRAAALGFAAAFIFQGVLGLLGGTRSGPSGPSRMPSHGFWVAAIAGAAATAAVAGVIEGSSVAAASAGAVIIAGALAWRA